ncbi:MAG: enoyl-CoA hydratase/isomerase family protein [Planctomycetes bacterium]|nr:enoyl-CoA hydratase/isomerase family protein [Planctomycetota bacterium]
MNPQSLIVEKSGGIAVVQVNRPKVLNALNAETIGELACVFAGFAADAEVKGVILTGAGEKAFVAGADISELAQQTPIEGQRNAKRGQELLDRIDRLGKPVIAAINGFALGGGLELALACTLRTASETARMGLPEVSLGIIPGYGGTQRLARIAGPGVAREWILTGEHFPAAEAHRVGVVNRVFPAAELMAGTRKMLETILSRGPIAVRYALDAIRRGADTDLANGLELEADLFGLISSSADMREGMRAFLEKRKAEFKNQ